MKKAKKTALQAMVCAAFAAAMVLAGCSDEASNEGDQTGVYVSEKGMKITYDNKANDSGKDFMRVFTQFVDGKDAKYGVKGVTCEIRQTNADVNNKSVFGFMFDLHKTKDEAGKETYDYYVVGIRPCDSKYYIEHYTGVPVGSFDIAADKVTISGTGVATKHWTGTKWDDGEGDFVSGTGVLPAIINGSFTTKVVIEIVNNHYAITVGNQETSISCASVSNEADKGGVAAYSCIYKNKSISGTMTLTGVDGALNLEVAEAE